MSEWQLINTTILFPITIWPVNCIRRRTEVPPLELGCGLSIVTSFYDFTIPEVIALATSYLSMPCLVVESLRRFPQFDDVLRCQQRIDIFIFFAEPVRGVLYSCNPYTGLYVTPDLPYKDVLAPHKAVLPVVVGFKVIEVVSDGLGL